MSRKRLVPKFDADKFIQEIELNYIEFTSSNLEKKKNSLPLMSERDVSVIIWKMLQESKTIEISFSNYLKITSILFDRIIKSNENCS